MKKFTKLDIKQRSQLQVLLKEKNHYLKLQKYLMFQDKPFIEKSKEILIKLKKIHTGVKAHVYTF